VYVMMTKIVFHGMTSIHNLDFDLDCIAIGKHPSSHIGSYDFGTQLSRHHAVLNWSEGVWWVRDLGSLHGTYVNSRQVTKETPVRVNSGDRLLVGNHELRLWYETR
jgi:pSer/pThr/pTyr-binding forkhead associated (FHA) protein